MWRTWAAAIVAEYEGQDTSAAWLIDLASGGSRGGSARALEVAGQPVAGAAIDAAGDHVLVDRGGFLNPPGAGVVDVLPVGGGPVRVLINHGSEPSWNL